MRLKLRSPNGAQVLSLEEDATVGTLTQEIRQAASISGDLDIKCGYPPKPLLLNEYSSNTLLSTLPIKLQGEQLIISAAGGGGSLRSTGAGVVKNEGGKKETSSSTVIPAKPSRSQKASVPFSFTDGAPKVPTTPLSLTRAAPKFNKDDPPDVRLESGRGTIVLRVMEDDNSCLFQALSYAFTRSMMSVEELRQVAAQTIQENSEMYSEAVLEQNPDAYCEWIKMESSWGGGIELGIFASFFDMEITTIDVATGNMIRFNEGKSQRVIVVYSGIHYDTLALSPAGSLVHESDNDEMVFSVDDAEILQACQELCNKLKRKNYFTDTKNFDLRCNVCRVGLKGEKGAIEHATATGHHDFGEF